MGYVTYTDLGGGAGQSVREEDFSPEDWAYYILHGNVVLQGSESDPNILAARASGEAYVDPRDVRIAELEAQLAAATGGSVLPEPDQGTETATDSDQVDAQQKVDMQQANTPTPPAK
jgi:hypothetical protein